MTFLCLRRSLAFGGRLLCLLILFSFFGCKKKPGEDYDYLKPVNVSNTPLRSNFPSIGVDSKGTVHLVWTEDVGGAEEHIRYAKKEKDGNWTESVAIPYSLRGRFPSIAIDKDDKVHLAWQNWVSTGNWWGWVIFYSYKPFGGNWSVPETVWAPSGVSPQIDVDSRGRVFLIWQVGGYSTWVYFSMREIDGIWTSPIPISPRGYIFENKITVDIKGNTHVIWDEWDGEYTADVYYTMRDTSGRWSAPSVPFFIKKFAMRPLLTSDKDGNVHIAWEDSTLIYMHKSLEGNWSEPEFPGINLVPDDIAVDNNGTVYISYYGTRLIKKPKNGNWEKTFKITEWGAGISSLAIDNEGVKHLAWVGYLGDTLDNSDIFYVEVKNY